MTALGKYIRLEAEGEWREAATTPSREVLLSFGKASLVISDFSENPLTHWALRAIERIDEVGGTVIFAASEDAQETLAVKDAEMIEAIETVSRDARTPGRQRGRLTRPLMAVVLIGLIGCAVMLGPQLAREQALRLIAPEQRELVSAQLMDRLPERCSDPQGVSALQRLTRKIGGTDAPKIHVLPMQGADIARLPDGQILISSTVLGSPDAMPETAAGWIATALSLGRNHTGLARMISQKSGPEALAFLFSGVITEAELDQMAGFTLRDGAIPTSAEIETAMRALADNGVSPAAFLQAAPTDWPSITAEEPANPVVVLEDQDWVALQGICGT